jgi:hypothetical protein
LVIRLGNTLPKSSRGRLAIRHSEPIIHRAAAILQVAHLTHLFMDAP